MRIALIVYSMSGLGGGMERSATNLCNHWAGAGHEPTIVTLSSPDLVPHYPLHAGVRLRQLDLRRPAASKWGAMRQMASTALAIRKVMRGLRAEAVVAFGGQTCVLTVAGCLGTGIPVVAAERTHPAHYPIGRGWDFLRKLFYPFADALVAQTGEIARWYADNLSCRRVEVIPNVVLAPARIAARGPSERCTLVAAGLLAPVKRFDMLIEAFAAVAPRFPDWDLVIYGEGALRGDLESLVRQKGLETRISFPGRVDNLGEAMSRGDLFAMTSRTEGFPNVLGEAMACGLPAVSFDLPSGPADLIRHGVDGLLVANGDVGALAESLAELMGDDARRREFGARAREAADRFSESRVMAKWSVLLESVRAGKDR